MKAAVVGYTEKYSPQPIDETNETPTENPTSEQNHQPEDEQSLPVVTEQELDELEKLDLEALIVSADSDVGGAGEGQGEGDAEGHEGARESSVTGPCTLRQETGTHAAA